MHLRCPLPAESLWQSTGLGDYIRSSCCSVQEGFVRVVRVVRVNTISWLSLHLKRENQSLCGLILCCFRLLRVQRLPPISVSGLFFQFFYHFDRLSGWQVGEIIPCHLFEPKTQLVFVTCSFVSFPICNLISQICVFLGGET